MSKGSSFKRFHIGPGAASLIMILIVLSMSALGILALVNTHSDHSLSLRSAAVAEEIYHLNEQAENHLAALDALLVQAQQDAADDTAYLNNLKSTMPEGFELDGQTIRWEERSSNNRVLSCAIHVEPLGSTPRSRWIDHALYYDYDEMEYDGL